MRLSDLKPAWLIRREAINWLARLRGRPETETSFRRWYGASARNAAAFDLEEDRFRRSYGLLRSSPLASDRSFSPIVRDEPARPRFALAAALAAVLVVPTALLVATRTGILAGSSQAMMLVSRVGEIRTIPLADGSSVTLDTQSRVRIELTEAKRAAWVEQGRARFRIKQGNAPFKVTSGAITVESPGAIIDVARLEPAERIEVRAGSAQFTGDAQPGARLAPGQAATASPSGQAQIISAPKTPDWTTGMLEFDATPLSTVIDEANRYSARQIRLADRRLSDLEVTGTFRAGDSEVLVDALARAFKLRRAPGQQGGFILSATGATPPAKKNGG